MALDFSLAPPNFIPFAPNISKIEEYLNGNLGIAEKLESALRSPIISSIKDPVILEKFLAQKPPSDKMGLIALEKVIISSMLESQKPLIELALIFISLLGVIEDVICLYLAGNGLPVTNPNRLERSMMKSVSSPEMIEKISKLKSLLNKAPEPETSNPQAPDWFFSLYMNSKGETLEPGEWIKNSGRYYDNIRPEMNVIDHKKFREEEIDHKVEKLKSEGKVVDMEMIQNSKNGFTEEDDLKNFDNLNKESYFYKKYKNKKMFQGTSFEIQVPDLLKNYLHGNFQEIEGEEIYLNPESDYDISLIKINNTDQNSVSPNSFPLIPNSENEIQITPGKDSNSSDNTLFLVQFKLKEENLSRTQGNLNIPKGPGEYTLLNFPAAIPGFVVNVLGIIFGKLMPLISTITTILENPPGFLGQILTPKLKEKFEGFNLQSSENKEKYVVDGKSILDSVARIPIPIFGFGIETVLGNLEIVLGPQKEGETKNGMISMMISFIILPLQVLKMIFEKILDFVKDFIILPKLPGAILDLISFKWLVDILSPTTLLQLLGVKFEIGELVSLIAEIISSPGDKIVDPGKFFAAPFLAPLPKMTASQALNVIKIPVEMVMALLSLIQEFLNSFISMPQDIFGLIDESGNSVIGVPKIDILSPLKGAFDQIFETISKVKLK